MLRHEIVELAESTQKLLDIVRDSQITSDSSIKHDATGPKAPLELSMKNSAFLACLADHLAITTSFLADLHQMLILDHMRKEKYESRKTHKKHHLSWKKDFGRE